MHKVFRQVLAHIPRRLPVGMTEFAQLIADLKATYDLPTTSDLDIENVVSSAIINGSDKVTHKPLKFFYTFILNGAQKQVAGQAFRNVRDKYKALNEAAIAAAKAAEEAAKATEESTPNV